MRRSFSFAFLTALTALVGAGCNTSPPGVKAGATEEVPSPPSPARTREALKKAELAPAASKTDGQAAAAALAHHVTLAAVSTGGGASQPLPSDSLPLVIITKNELLFGERHVASLEPGPQGFDAAIKRAGQRSALQLLPLDDLLKGAHDAEPAQAEVRFLFDASTSYRAALEVLFTASHEGFTSFDFLVRGAGDPPGTPTRALVASTPTKAEWDASHTAGAPQPVSLVLTHEGVTFSVGAVTIGPDCTRGRNGTTLPTLDAAKAGECAARVKGMVPAWSSLRIANVSAANGLDLTTVLGVVAAIAPSFPTIHFGMITG